VGAKWITPFGGSIVTGAGSSDIEIKWDNKPEVGEARYQVNGEYIWDVDVNVVQITITASTMVYGGPPAQIAAGSALITSDPAFPASTAMKASVTINVTGAPTPGGPRGIKFLQLGFIQDAEFTEDNGVYADGSERKFYFQDGEYHVDYDINNGGPWYSTAAGYYLAPVGDVNRVGTVLGANDTPQFLATDTMAGVEQFNLEFDCLLFFCVRTTLDVNGSDAEYAPEGEAKWHFNGTGLVNGAGVWAPSFTAGDGGDAAFSPPVDIPTASGDPCNQLLANQQNEFENA
jgi:hypothetical protein